MNIIFDTDTSLEFPSEEFETIVKDIVSYTIDRFDIPYECQISFTFTDNKGIAVINKDFRDIDSPTDVLSFPMLEYDEPGKLDDIISDDPDYFDPDVFDPDTGELILGDIVISVEKAKAQALEYGHSIKREIAFLTAHSMLHLLGYDHMTDEERVVMEELQEAILNEKGYTRDYE